MNINNFFNNLNNGVDEQLEIALLSEFAKACGISNSYELESLKSRALKNSQNNHFRSNSVVNSDTFKTQSNDEFKNNVSLLVYDIFFDLLKTEPGFFANMQETLISFSQGLISADNLRLIILDNISKDIDEIFNLLKKAEKEGKKVTNEEIRKIIKTSLVNNSKQINKDVVYASKKTSPEGLSSYTPYSRLALSQKYKGLRWRPIKGTSLSPKALQRLQKQTNKIKSNLEKVKSGLRTARSIVSLLKKLESTFSNGIAGILKSLSKIIFSYIRDIGSTGVYMLNMCEPYVTIENFISNDDMLKKVGNPDSGMTVDDYHKFMLNEKISRKKIIDSNSYMSKDLNNSTILINELKPEVKEKIDVNTNETLKKIMDFIYGIYKPTTHAEFVSTIGEAFMDEGDMPSNAIANFIKSNFEETNGSIKREKGTANKYYFGGIDSNYIRPGRPRFGKGSSANVTIIAFSIPNLIQLVGNSVAVATALINILRFFGMNLKPGWPVENWFDDNTNKIKKRMDRLWNKGTKNSIFDYYANPPVLNSYGKVISPEVDSEDPDFYGISVRGIFPDFFELMDILEARVNKYVKNFKSSLSKELDNLLKNIEELIDDLEDFINIIDEVINFFETLRTMGLYTLQITSNGGNEDIVEKIIAAEGFPGVEEGDKLRLIGGFVFCYGTPNLKPNQIDFPGIVKQKMAAMNYEAEAIKYESDPNSTDDPGSYEDYVSGNNFIGDYNSSLNKIFKKLF